VCCSVLSCVAACCSVFQCVAVCCSVLQCAAACFSVLQCVAVCCSVLQCVAVCCSVLHLCYALIVFCQVLCMCGYQDMCMSNTPSPKTLCGPQMRCSAKCVAVPSVLQCQMCCSALSPSPKILSRALHLSYMHCISGSDYIHTLLCTSMQYICFLISRPHLWYGVATISRLLKIICLFCK